MPYKQAVAGLSAEDVFRSVARSNNENKFDL
jgi:hypothetical protein